MTDQRDLKTVVNDAANQTSQNLAVLREAVRELFHLESDGYDEMDIESAQVKRVQDKIKDLVVEIPVFKMASTLSPYFSQGKDRDFTSTMLQVMHKNVENMPPSTAALIDCLALANLCEDSGMMQDVSSLLEEVVYDSLRDFGLNQALTSIDTIQEVYKSGDSGLSCGQIAKIDDELIRRVEKFISRDNKTPATADRMATMLLQIQDDEIYADLAAKLYDFRSIPGKLAYVRELIDDARIYEDKNAAVKNPVLARVGEVYGDVFEKVEKYGIASLMGIETDDPAQMTLINK